MMTISEQIKPIESFASEDDIVCIFCGNSYASQFHCGIIYKYNDTPYVLHLAGHKDFLNESIDKLDQIKYVWVKSKIPLKFQRTISASFRNIVLRESSKSIPYGLYYKDSRFDKEGILVLGGNEIGLTCATFVLSAFSSCNVNLIDVNNWQVREEDNSWHDTIIALLTKYKVELKISDEHLQNMNKEKYCARFRPEEVAASSAFSPQPDTFENISYSGVLLKNHITEQIKFYDLPTQV